MHVQVTYNCIIMVNWCEPKLRSNVKKNFFPHSFQKDFHIIIWHLILQKVTNKHSYWKTGTEREVFFQSLNVHFVVFLFWTMWMPLWKFLQKPNYKTASDLCKTSLCNWKNCFLKNQHTQHNYTSLVFHYKKERIIILLCINSTIHAFN